MNPEHPAFHWNSVAPTFVPAPREGESTGRPKRFETDSEEIVSVYSLEAGFALLMAFF